MYCLSLNQLLHLFNINFLFLAPDAKPVDLTPLTTKSPAVPLTHKDVASKKPNVDEYYPDRSNPERSEEYPKASNAEAAKKPALVPTARVVPTKKSDSPVHHPAVPSVQVTPPAAKVKADAEQQIDRERNLQNEQNLEDVNGVNPENVEIEDDKTKGTETNPNLEGNYLRIVH